jgi:hypothetical protein
MKRRLEPSAPTCFLNQEFLCEQNTQECAHSAPTKVDIHDCVHSTPVQRVYPQLYTTVLSLGTDIPDC